MGMRGAARAGDREHKLFRKCLKRVRQPRQAAGQEAGHLRGGGSRGGKECLVEVSIPGRG